jgi:tight adherence protein C
LFFRLIVPIGLFVVATFYMLVLDDSDWPMLLKLGIAIFAAYLGIKAPELFLKDATGQRQVSMRRAFPDAMDLLLICIESGMSIEHAFRKVKKMAHSLPPKLTVPMILFFLPVVIITPAIIRVMAIP